METDGHFDFSFQKNPAENLLKPEAYYKWKTATKGEHKAVVVLQVTCGQ